MIGWIKLHRKLLISDMYQDLNAVQRDVLLQCLLAANHKPKKWEWQGKIFECKAGQFITSLDSLIKLCSKGTSIRNVRTALVKLEKWQFLTNESTKTGRLITVINWDTYQNCDEATDKATDKEATKSRQSTDKEPTTNKNVKKDKNEKKEDKTFMSDSEEIRLVDYFISQIKINKPDFKEPNKQTWAKIFDLMLRLDKRQPRDIAELIKWCQNDSFEMSNVLSPDKLRKRFDQLMMKTKRKPSTIGMSRTEKNTAAKEEFLRKNGIYEKDITPEIKTLEA